MERYWGACSVVVELWRSGVYVGRIARRVWFSYGARRLPLATVGLLQFLAPTGHFLLATQLYGEPFTAWDITTFVLIWSALALYLGDLHRHQRALGSVSVRTTPTRWPSTIRTTIGAGFTRLCESPQRLRRD